MELTTTKKKLSLNKKVISKLSNYGTNQKVGAVWTEGGCGTRDCTFPECGSVPMCRTDIIKSCAPCVPPPVDPAGNTKGCW
jgi:hypothetical protein